jgi:hypothetical protein
MNITFFKKDYRVTFEGDSHPIAVRKHPNDESCKISVSNSRCTDSIDINRRQDLEQLHFCLGQLLGKGE